MARHPTSSRVHRDPSGPDDAFVSGIERTVAWVRKYQRPITIAVVAVILAAAGTLWYRTQQQAIENEAAARFTELQGTIAAGNMQLAIRDLQGFINRFGSTDVADQARLVLGDILLQQDQAEQALEALGDLPDDLRGPLGLAAARLQAAALEATGDAEQAVSTYLRIADVARFPFQAREALADAARVRLQNGDPDAAADLYQRVLATFEDENAAEAGYYRMWLAEARAKAAEGEGTAPIEP